MATLKKKKIIVPSEEGSGCLFANMLEEYEPSDWEIKFAKSAAEELLDMSSGDEIGGVLPGDYRAFAEEVLGTQNHPNMHIASNTAEALVRCVRARYLGECALSASCQLRDEVAEFINEVMLERQKV